MIQTRTARVAPEKAVFRPVLPRVSIAGTSTEEVMPTYSERLKDPRWQRRRLEILNRSNFTCERCEAADKTLHVHHKLYRKGAMPWEYTDAELQALCEDCHEEEHQVRTRLDAVLAELDLGSLEEVLGYASACLAESIVFGERESEDLPPNREYRVETYSEARGFYVRLISRAPLDDVEEFRALAPIDHRVVFSVAAYGLASKENAKP